MSVSAGTTPTFSWTPACRLYYLDVSTVDGAQELWAVGNADGRNSIGPGVRYGVVPEGASGIEGPVPLVAGATYYVFVGFVTPDGSDEFAGDATFTP